MTPVSRYTPVLIFVAAVVITLIAGILTPASLRQQPPADMQAFYQPVAQNLAAGRGLVDDQGNFADRYPPGQPLILAAIIGLAGITHLSSDTIIHGFILLCSGLSAVFVYAIARSVWSIKQSALAALLWMTYPFWLYATQQLLTEIPFIVILYGALALFWRIVLCQPRHIGYLFVCGLLIGLAALIRPIGGPLIVVLAVLAYMSLRESSRQARILAAALVLVGGLIPILPWEAMIYSQTDEVVPLSTGGGLSMRDGLTFAIVNKHRVDTPVPDNVFALEQQLVDQYGKLFTFGGIASVLADKARSEPLALAELFAIKAARSWYGTDSSRLDWLILVLQIPYLAVTLWGAVAAWKRGGRARLMAAGVGAITLTFWLLTTLVLSILRYMLPIMGLLFILIPAIIHRWEPAEAQP